MRTTPSKPFHQVLISSLLLLGCAPAALAQALDFDGATTWGDVLLGKHHALLTTAFVDPEFPQLSDGGDTGAGSAIDIVVLEPAVGLPEFALGEFAYEGSALTLAFSAAAGSMLSFDWSVGGADLADLAWVWLNDAAPQPIAQTNGIDTSGTFSIHLVDNGNHRIGWAIVDQYDYVGTSTLRLSNLAVQTSPVPEPASLALTLLGLCGLSLRLSRHAR